MRKFKAFLIILISISLTGCTSLFVKKDSPKILNSNSAQFSKQEDSILDTNNIAIEEINSDLTEGLVYDLSYDGDLLLLGNPSTTITLDAAKSANYFNLHIYNIKEKQLKQVLLSSKEQSNAIFDKKNKGIIYVEYNKDENGKAVEHSYQLNWTDYEGNTSKNISLPNESVSPEFSKVNEEYLIYGTDKGNIRLVEIDKITDKVPDGKTYSLSKNLSIYKIDYYEEYNIAFFLVNNPTTNSKDLYYTLLDKSEVDPIMIQTNVKDFYISSKNKCVLFNISGEKVNQLASIDMNYNKTIIYEGPISTFYITPNEEKIIVGEKADNSSNNQNIWIMNYDGTSAVQIASNLKIANNRILVDQNNKILYFSVYNIADEGLNKVDYQVYMIKFNAN